MWSLERSTPLPSVSCSCMCVPSGVDMCGRTVMVLVGRNIPVTLIDIEKVTGRPVRTASSVLEHFNICFTFCVCVCVAAGLAILYPRHGPHHSEGVRDGVLSHSDRGTQPSRLGLPQEAIRHCRCKVRTHTKLVFTLQFPNREGSRSVCVCVCSKLHIVKGCG